MPPRRACATRLTVALFCAITVDAQLGLPADLPSDDAGTDGIAAPVTVEQVLAVWSQREARLQTFRANWVHERTYTRFWAHCHVPSARDEYVTLRFGESLLTVDGDRWRFDSGRVDSSGDAIEFAGGQHVDAHGRLAHDDAQRVFRDDRIRYDGGRPRVDPREPQVSRWPRNLRAFTTCSVGESHWQFLPAERGEYPEAYLFAGPALGVQESLHLLPLIADVRPSWLGLAPADCSIEPETQSFRGHDCRVLVDQSGLRREVWLDLERDFAPVSIRMDCDVLGARMKNRVDIDYYRGADSHWLPSGWTTVILDNYGLLEQYAAATVLEAVANPTVDTRVFEPEFPGGTWVFDETARTHAILTDDGNRAPISDRELRDGSSYAELVARGTWRGRAGTLIRSIRQSSSLRLGLTALLSGAVAAWVWRRAGRLRRQRGPINA